MAPPKPNKKHIFRIVAIIAGIITVIVVLYFIWAFYVPFIGAKTKLISEEGRLGISHSSMTQSYVGGGCLDNCPELTTYYDITPATLASERTTVANVLKSKGYSFNNPMPGDSEITASQGNFQIDVGIGYNPNNPNAAVSSDSASINTVVVLLDYSPN